MATVGGLDSGPNLFHALGKVLYCKRGVKKEEHFLRPGCESRRRLTLLTDPTELLDRLPVAKETFASHLHQNYPPFFSSVEDAAAAAEALSVSDVFFGKFESRGKISLEDYGGEVAVRGVCYANRDVAKQKGMRTFSKTEGYENAKAIRQRFVIALVCRYLNQLDYILYPVQERGDRIGFPSLPSTGGRNGHCSICEGSSSDVAGLDSRGEVRGRGERR